jgi:hypothetical protein
MSLTTNITPECVAAVTLRMAKALTALALQRPIRRDVRYHRNPQNADLGQRRQFRQF